MDTTTIGATESAAREHFDRLGNNGYWARLYADVADPRIRWSFVRRQMNIEALVPRVAPPGALVVEIGPGTGNLIRFLAEHGYRYRGYDTSVAMVAETRDAILRHFGPRSDATCSLGDVYRLPLGDGAADLVIASGVFEYLDNPQAAAAELARITRPPDAGRPGGCAIITFPNAASLNRILGNRLQLMTRAWHGWLRLTGQPIAPPDVHREAYDVRRVRDVFEPAGWRLENEHYYDVEVMPYPLKRLFPDLAFRAKRRWESADAGLKHVLANGLIAVLHRQAAIPATRQR